MLTNFVNRPLKWCGRIQKVTTTKISSMLPFARVMWDQDGTPVVTGGKPDVNFDDGVPPPTTGLEFGILAFFVWLFFAVIT